MSWLAWHKESERFASEAHLLMCRGEYAQAQGAFRRAAQAEAKAIDDLDPSKTRTLGITAVSVISLWFKAKEYQKAEKASHDWLASGVLPLFAIEQIKIILQSIWTDQAMAQESVNFLPGQVLVSIKGGQTVTGGAPLDLIVEKVQIVQSLFYRTVEFLTNLPHRKHGAPNSDIQAACRPWLFQAPPGSYQFSIAIQGAPQGNLFPSASDDADIVASHFLSILKASTEAPEKDLPNLVPQEDYQNTFLGLARALAPTGSNASHIEIRGVNDSHGVVLIPESRKIISKILKERKEKDRPITKDIPVQIVGVLRAVHLDADWIEVVSDSGPLRIKGVSDAVDDVIGPMVNHKVIVQAIKRGTDHTFLDIEPEE